MEGSIGSGTPKLDWADAPDHVRTSVESLVGASVVEAVSMPGGFNPGVSARLLFDDGSTAFTKSAAEDVNAASARMHRREAEVVDALADLRQVPDLIGWFDESGWVTLVFEDVSGRHPTLPWHREELEQVLRAHDALAGRLTPAPFEAEPLVEATDEFDCWTHLAERPHLLGDLDAGWAADRMEELLALQAGWTDAVAGDALLHGDLRADQILFADGRVVFVDWPHACTGPAWADVVMMIPSVVLQGGPGPEEIVAMSPSAGAAAGEDVMALVAAMAGGLLWYATKPPPPGLPTVREFQRAQGGVLLDWIARSQGWTARRP